MLRVRRVYLSAAGLAYLDNNERILIRVLGMWWAIR